MCPLMSCAHKLFVCYSYKCFLY